MVHLDDRRGADRVKDLLAGDIAAAMVTPEAMYDLEKTGQIKRFNRLTDHKQLKIYAGGGADYAISAAFLKNRRAAAKQFMSGICEGISIARKDSAKALEFVAKSGRKMDAAGIEYLYRLYITDVIPARPHLKMEGIELAVADDCVATSRRWHTERPSSSPTPASCRNWRKKDVVISSSAVSAALAAYRFDAEV